MTHNLVIFENQQCMNYYCENVLTEWELNKLRRGGRNYFTHHFCKKCRPYLKTVQKFRCVKCREPFYSDTYLRFRCSKCQIRKSSYKLKGGFCKICSGNLPKHKSVYCSRPCRLKGKLIINKRWEDNHDRSSL